MVSILISDSLNRYRQHANTSYNYSDNVDADFLLKSPVLINVNNRLVIIGTIYSTT